jgi:hypothetical protein
MSKVLINEQELMNWTSQASVPPARVLSYFQMTYDKAFHFPAGTRHWR